MRTAIFDFHPAPQNLQIAKRPDDRRDPRRVDHGQGKYFHHHGHVIRMAHPAVRARNSPRPRATTPSLPRSSVRQVSESPTNAEDWTSTNSTSHRNGERGNQRTVKKQNFGAGARRGRRRATTPSIENAVREFCGRPAFRADAGCAGKSQFRKPPDPHNHQQGRYKQSSWPLQQEHLRRESRPERHQQAVASRRHFFLHQPFVQDK